MCGKIEVKTMIECPECKKEYQDLKYILIAHIKPLENGLITIDFVCTKFKNKHRFKEGINLERIAREYFSGLKDI